MLKHSTVPFSLRACRQSNNMLPNLTLYCVASYGTSSTWEGLGSWWPDFPGHSR